jgi:hypothetical protein
MKFRIILNVAFFTMLIFLVACESKPKQEVTPDIKVNVVAETCGLHDYREGRLIKRMNPVCAKALIDNYEVQIDSIKQQCSIPNIDSLLIRGARVNLAELKRMIFVIDSISSSNAKSVFIMLGAHNSENNEPAGIIFAFEHGENNLPDPYSYFNFTQPCPNACPD